MLAVGLALVMQKGWEDRFFDVAEIVRRYELYLIYGDHLSSRFCQNGANQGEVPGSLIFHNRMSAAVQSLLR